MFMALPAALQVDWAVVLLMVIPVTDNNVEVHHLIRPKVISRRESILPTCTNKSVGLLATMEFHQQQLLKVCRLCVGKG